MSSPDLGMLGNLRSNNGSLHQSVRMRGRFDYLYSTRRYTDSRPNLGEQQTGHGRPSSSTSAAHRISAIPLQLTALIGVDQRLLPHLETSTGRTGRLRDPLPKISSMMASKTQGGIAPCSLVTRRLKDMSVFSCRLHKQADYIERLDAGFDSSSLMPLVHTL